MSPSILIPVRSWWCWWCVSGRNGATWKHELGEDIQQGLALAFYWVPLQTGTCWLERFVPMLWRKGSCWRCRSGRILTIEISEQARRKYTRKKQVLRYCLLSEILLVLRNNGKAWWYLVHMLCSVSCGLNGWETRAELQLLVLRLARQGWGARTWADGIIIACKLNAWAHGTHFFLCDIEGHSHPFRMLFVIHTDIKIN